MLKSWMFVAAGVAAALAFGACGGSGSVSSAAEDAIEGDLAEQIDLGEIVARCDEPAERAEGETFACTAATEDDRVIDILGTMEDEDNFRVVTTNLLTADDIAGFLPVIADSISQEVGQDVTPEDITCPEATVILDDDGNFECEIVDREGTGATHVLLVTTGGLEPGGGPRDLGWEIGEEIP